MWNRKKTASVTIDSDVLASISVFWILMSSTTVVFSMKNMLLTIMVLLAIAGMLLLRNKVISKRNMRIFGTIVAILVVNWGVNRQYYVLNEDLAILMIRLVSCMIIASSIHNDQFIKQYVHIMKWMAVVSLLCFAYTTILDIPLPFQATDVINNGTYKYTFYYVVQGSGGPNRNNGMFWEPGGYQIFLNIALLFVICRPELFSKTKSHLLRLIILFVATIISTLSTTAFLCVFMVLVIGVMNSELDKAVKRKLVSAVTVAVVVMLIAESYLGIIETKLINQGGSYSTRMNDAIVTFTCALSRPLWGYGLFNNQISSIFAQNNIVSNSNGLGALACSMGIVVAAIYVVWMTVGLKQILHTNIVATILIGVLFVIFFVTEGVMLITLFVFLLFSTKKMEESMEVSDETQYEKYG